MGVRVLSGTLVTRDAARGVAVIEFRDNSLAGGTTPGVRLDKAYTAGDAMPGSGRFQRVPAHMVSIRELKIVETEWGRISREGQEIELLRIDTGTIDRSTMEIRWSGSSGSRIEEISYMIIGDV
jgi:hypothetical protein